MGAETKGTQSVYRDMDKLKKLVKNVRNLAVDLAWSIRNGEFYMGFEWDKEERPDIRGYYYTWYDGPLSVFWWGPFYVNWTGDSFGQDHWAWEACPVIDCPYCVTNRVPRQ